ncbi:hypothetical protein B0H10DRAFT_2198836 [Mycena sp. CBHHK59/15]|nr:hypothetical protein B0H10DRAFT_2198836 [Mycena sp. CBHHK59/15]
MWNALHHTRVRVAWDMVQVSTGDQFPPLIGRLLRIRGKKWGERLRGRQGNFGGFSGGGEHSTAVSSASMWVSVQRKRRGGGWVVVRERAASVTGHAIPRPSTFRMPARAGTALGIDLGVDWAPISGAEQGSLRMFPVRVVLKGSRWPKDLPRTLYVLSIVSIRLRAPVSHENGRSRPIIAPIGIVQAGFRPHGSAPIAGTTRRPTVPLPPKILYPTF